MIERRLTYARRVFAVSPVPPIASWPLGENSGAVALDVSGRAGAYTAVALNRPGKGDGGAAAGFDGTTSFCNIFSAALAAAFNGAAGSIHAWFRLPETSDGTNRFIINLFTDNNNRIVLDRTAATTMRWRYIAGGTTNTANITAATTQWRAIGLTWDKAADQCKAYLNGAQTGATVTGLGTFTGAIVTALIGASTATPTLAWSGDLQDVAVWPVALPPGAIAELYQPGIL